MRNVLAVINTPTFGGPHNQLLRLNDSLMRRGWRYLAVLPDGDEMEAESRLVSGGVEVVRMPLHRLRAQRKLQPHLDLMCLFSSEVQALRKLIEARDIDVVQVCGTLNLQPAMAASRSHKGLVWQLLSNFSPWALRAALTPVIATKADVVMSTGMRVAREHAGLSMMAREILSFFPPVNTDAFRPDPDTRRQAREYLRVPEDAFLVGTVGNFNRQKGYERIVAAVPEVLKLVPEAHIRVLGAVTPA